MRGRERGVMRGEMMRGCKLEEEREEEVDGKERGRYQCANEISRKEIENFYGINTIQIKENNK